MSEQNMLIVTSVFKGTTINKKMRLDHDSLSHPETRILRWFGYILCKNCFAFCVCFLSVNLGDDL